MSRRISDAGEAEQLAVASRQLPAEPADLVVLRVAVVVAALGAADLVAAEQHRHALAEEQRGEEVALLLLAGLDDRLLIGLALDAEVHALVVVVAVAVVLAVGLVVLRLVADEVVEGEAVVGGDEVDAGVRPAPGAGVQVGASR